MLIDFYICRHGQTDKNVEGVWSGSGIDVPLNEKGKEQAVELAQKLRGKHVAIYCSPLVRAVQTANAVANGRDIVIMQDLREGNFGDMEGVTFAKAKEIYGEEFINSLLFPTEETADWHFPNAESKRMVFERVYTCLNRIVCNHSFNYALHEVCVVCHAGVISALEFGLKLKKVSLKNCAVLHLVYDTEQHQFAQVFD